MANVYNNDNVSIGTSSLQVVPSREKRLFISLTNEGTNTIYLYIGESPAAINKGLPLAAGANLILDREDKNNAAIYGIAPAGSNTLCICEEYLDSL